MKFKPMLAVAAACGVISTTITVLMCSDIIRDTGPRQDWSAIAAQIRDIAMCAVLVWAVKAIYEIRVKPAWAYKLGDEDGYRRAMRDKADAPIPFTGRTRMPAGRR